MPLSFTARAAETEQAAIERAGRRMKEGRICRAVRIDSRLALWQLEERFGWPQDTISNVLHRAGMRWNGSEWAAHRRRRRRS